MFSMTSKSDCNPGMMRCCKVQTDRRWWQGTSGCVGSGALLVLLPKCPMCIAAYLTLWTGASVAMPIATHLRPMMAILFLASILLLGFRWALRTRSKSAVGGKAVGHVSS